MLFHEAGKKVLQCLEPGKRFLAGGRDSLLMRVLRRLVRGSIKWLKRLRGWVDVRGGQ